MSPVKKPYRYWYQRMLLQAFFFWVCFGGFATLLMANNPGGVTLSGSGTAIGAAVTLSGTASSSSTVTMSNGIVSIVITKTDASIHSISYTYNNNGTNTTTQVLSGGTNGGQLYWLENSGSFIAGPFTMTVVANTGDYAEINLSYASPSNGVMEIHYSMLRGSPGFYATPILTHRAQDAQIYITLRPNIYAGSIFNWMSVDPDRNRLMEVPGGTTATCPTSPVENYLWTSGIYQGRYEDKYKYTANLYSLPAWGWSSVATTNPVFAGKNIGIWNIIGSGESYPGGPLERSLMNHIGTTILNVFTGGYFGLGTDGTLLAGEVWTKTYGPYFYYLNNIPSSITDPVQASQALYNDAIAQGAAERAAWPYSWFSNANYTPASGRGTVTGKMVISDSGNPNASAADLWVGVVKQPTNNTSVYDFQRWTKPYQFWVKTDASGNFKIPNVIAGTNYTLYAFGPGAVGTFMSQAQTGGNPPLLYNLPATPFGVTVTGGATTALGNVTWTPTRVGPTVFEIGYPDRTARKFRHGDDYWVGDIGASPTAPSSVWTKFMEYPFDFPKGPNYVVGTSRWGTDWNFIQPSVYNSSGGWDTSTSTITFNLPAGTSTAGNASLYLGLCSDYYAAIIVTINGKNVSSLSGLSASPTTSVPSTGYYVGYGDSDSSIREGNNGAFSDERLTFPASVLKTGTAVNTITIGFRQIGGSYFADHAMYDYIRLELTGYVPPAPASVSTYAGNNSVLLSWPVIPGATSYNVLRSITSGTNFTAIASGTSAVTGPVSGSGPGNATYLDTTAANDTTYYYKVQSVNVNTTGTNGTSSQSSGVTPSSSAPTTAPVAPSVTATGTSGSVTVAWSASAGANYYTVQRSTLVDKMPVSFSSTLSSTSTVLSTTTLSNSITGTSFTDTTVTNGTKYAYTVLATNAAGTSGTSTAYVARPLAVGPSAAPTVTATAGTQQVTLNWSAVAGATGYVVQVATAPGGPYTFLTTVSSLTYTDTGNADNTTYYYVVAATNSGGISANSAEVSATTAPAPPTNVTATVGNTQATLSWTAAPGATGYVVRRATTSGAETTIASGVVGTTYTNNLLTNGTTYYYVVASTNASGTGVDSTEVSVTPSASVPVAPTGLTATGSNAQVILNWNASAGATSYILRRSTANGGPYSTTAATGLAATTFTDTGLTNGTTYYYVVQATGTGGTGAYSTQANAAPIAPLPAAPTGLTATGSDAQVILNWNAAAGATSYILKRGTASGQESLTVKTGIAGTTFTDTSLTNGVSYYYVVSGSNSAGIGSNSNEASAKPAQTFGQWIAAVFPGQSDPKIIGNAADPDGDGVPNVDEYFMGTNPAFSDASPMTCQLDGLGNAVLSFRMAKNLSGVSYSIDQSTDLATWTSTGQQGSVAADMGNYYMMKATIPLTANTKLFFRLSISSP